MTTVSVRSATDDDLPATLDIYNDAILTTTVAHFKEVGYKFGRWLDLKFLELLLDNKPGPV